MAEILGTGVDIVDIGRIAELRKKHGDRLCGLVFLPAEMEYCLARANADECLAARFAAKEAVMKALGTGWAEGVAFMGIEVVREGEGRPSIRLHGGAAAKAAALGVGRIHLSLSHSKEMAIAQAILEKKTADFREGSPISL
ncbi:MAG: holo-ACP synthase [Planctomycetota bacterium]|jgi:holo-[acyl-carrier protein] synthase|nr:holo-ACP synthase [Planctomycetota bacterium]